MEALKRLLSLFLTKINDYRSGESYVAGLIDTRRACFHAAATRDVYLDLPREDQEERMRGKLDKSMYGTRNAAQKREIAYMDLTKSTRFEAGKASPCTSYDKQRLTRVTVYRNDLTMLKKQKGT